MDIQKEREEFELNISPVIWERIEYNAENNIYMAKSKYWTSSIVQAVANEIDFGWKMWQAAKAQAVPEGFILMPLAIHANTIFPDILNQYPIRSNSPTISSRLFSTGIFIFLKFISSYPLESIF